MSGELDGRTALLTGAARRLGRAVALALSEAGAGVVLHHRASAEEAHGLAREIGDRGGKAWTLEADLADAAAADALVSRAEALAGRVDLLVNNASVFPAGGLDAARLADAEHAFRVNAWAPLATTRALARAGRDARVVNVLDARPLRADRVAYSLSKAALAAATRLLALELAPRVTVNAVAPGPVLAPDGAAPDHLARVAAAVPLRRPGTPEDVARAVVFLLASPFLTGQVVYVDGGEHLVAPGVA